MNMHTYRPPCSQAVAAWAAGAARADSLRASAEIVRARYPEAPRVG